MDEIVPVFQLEIRYNHLLNFSEIGKELLTPFARLTSTVDIQNLNLVNERIHLTFGEDNYVIIVSGDRILLKGQHPIEYYTSKNSPVDTPFLQILEKLKEVKEFGSVLNALYAVIKVKPINKDTSEIVNDFNDKFLTKEALIFGGITDCAISLEDISSDKSNQTFLKYGLYNGVSDLRKQQLLQPVNFLALENVDTNGVMLEYKQYKEMKSFSKLDFINFVDKSNEVTSKLWKLI